MDWLGTAPIFLAAGIVLAFAIKDASLAGTVRVEDLPAYLLAGMRTIAIVLPLQLGLQAGTWGLGALRIARNGPRRGEMQFRLPVILAGMALFTSIFASIWRTVFLFPLAYPLQAAFLAGEPLSTWLFQAGAALATAGLGLLLLLATAGKIHLGRGGPGNVIGVRPEPGSKRPEFLFGRIDCEGQPTEGFSFSEPAACTERSIGPGLEEPGTDTGLHHCQLDLSVVVGFLGGHKFFGHKRVERSIGGRPGVGSYPGKSSDSPLAERPGVLVAITLHAGPVK